MQDLVTSLRTISLFDKSYNLFIYLLVTHKKAIKAALNELASPQHSSVHAIALKFEVAETILSHKEMQLVGYCLNMQSLEFSLTRSGVNYCVIEIVKSNNHENPFNNKRLDKTGFVISSRVQKVLAKKGARQVYKIAYNNVHEHISIAPTISGTSNYIPLLFIYKGIHAIPGLLTGAPPSSVIAFMDSGYMKESIFEMYIKHFVNSIPPSCPVLLILDRHKSYINYTYINFCYENNILLYALPSHITHILQLAEILFSKLKKEYDEGCDRLHNNNGEIVTKYSFTSILGPVYIKAFTPKAIMNSFKTTEIWPFNPDAISINHLNPLLLTERTDLLLLLTKQTLLLPLLPTSSLSSSSLLSTLTSPLKLILKYPTPRLSSANESETGEASQQLKKRKTLPFA
ncbi:3907_t:CDS:2 [Cetraspora pellucida]|uniref:3907_t:CDS:1 n=1 Tax=Cetraspora pellucida TaxID=1433469 RepID=A0A9N8VMI9_9GLOM|nr:3907_t:CDS:2 [Cetraspora pellucida]